VYEGSRIKRDAKIKESLQLVEQIRSFKILIHVMFCVGFKDVHLLIIIIVDPKES